MMHGGDSPQIQAYARARLEITQDRVLQEMAHIGFHDIREAFDENGNLKRIQDFPDRLARSVAGIEFEDIYAGTGAERVKIGRTAKIKLIDKLGGLDKIARHLGMYANETQGATANIQLVVMPSGAAATAQLEPALDIMSLVKK